MDGRGSVTIRGDGRLTTMAGGSIMTVWAGAGIQVCLVRGIIGRPRWWASSAMAPEWESASDLDSGTSVGFHWRHTRFSGPGGDVVSMGSQASTVL